MSSLASVKPSSEEKTAAAPADPRPVDQSPAEGIGKVRYCLAFGRYDLAIQFAQKIPAQDDQIHAFNLVCHAYAWSGKYEKALKLANQIPDYVQKMHSRVWVHCLADEFSAAQLEVHQNEKELDPAFKNTALNIISCIQKRGSNWVGYDAPWLAYDPLDYPTPPLKD